MFLGDVENDSAGYISGYVTKKMTNRDDPWLRGRHPEFARMSLRPGIGSEYMWEVASTMLEHALDETMPDVPSGIAYGKQVRPFGRYLKGILRERIGRDKKAPKVVLEAMAQELLSLREAAFNESRSFRKAVIDSGAGRRALIDSRNAIFKKERPQ